MCRKNLLVFIIYLLLTIVSGFYLGEMIVGLYSEISLWSEYFIRFISVVVIGLFLLPILENFLD